jgi:peptidoglycan/xylan/chitin deacetylase (PgdA/CDA1 family)
LTSVAEYGAPIVQDCGFHATVFVVSGWVGRWNDWPGQPASAPRWRLMDWAALRSLADAGIAIGAHSISHPHLPRLSIGEQEREVVGSVRTLEDRLGVPVQSFAYPYGESSRAAEAAVAAHGKAGFGTTLDFVRRGSRIGSLERIDSYYLRPDVAGSLDRWWFDRYLGARRIARAIKRGLGPEQV